MRKIVFTGQLNTVEFASRWRRELFPEQVKTGRDYAKKKSQVEKKYTSKRMRDAVLEKDKTLIKSVKKDAEKARKQLNTKNVYDPLSIKSPNSNQGRSIRDFEKERLASSKARKGIFNSRSQSSEQVAEKLFPSNLFQSKEPPISTNSSSSTTKVISSSSNIKTSLLTPKAKGSVNKAGLVGAGLLTAGAIGYGVYRATRKDKGKKRGTYRK